MQQHHPARVVQLVSPQRTPSGVFPREAPLMHRSALVEVPAGEAETAAVVAALRAVTGSHSLHAALEAGEIIFRHVFHGDESLLRARGNESEPHAGGVTLRRRARARFRPPNRRG